MNTGPERASTPHRVVFAMLVRAGRVLLVHRSPERPWYANSWDLPGGHLEGDESPEGALRRECREELGITFDTLRPLDISLPDPEISAWAFEVDAWRGEPTNLQPDEHDDLAWFGPDDLPADGYSYPGQRGWLQQHLRAGR
ncbi:NUDIX domain-containing protein [Micrococcales bacterium 31B]|nr:NUDIX domain-containing protein [Micrococcales bacterium 31B]